MRVAIPELFRRELDGRLPAVVEPAWYANLRDVAAAARGADVLVIGFIDGVEIRAAIEAARHARWVSTHAAGVDHYPFDLLRSRGLVLTNGAGINAPPIAEFTVLCVLSAAKSFPVFLRASDAGEWARERPPAQELEGSRALVIGYGEIGRAIGERLRGLGVCVTGVRRSAPLEEPGVGAALTSAERFHEEVVGPSEWRERLAEFDWIIASAALTDATRRMLGAAEFARMRPDAWVFNVARGGLIDHVALAAALADGRPRGAYLDVTEPEPLPTGHPLWGMPNVFITGHSAGRSARSHQRYVAMLLENLGRFARREPLANVVDFAAGY